MAVFFRSPQNTMWTFHSAASAGAVLLVPSEWILRGTRKEQRRHGVWTCGALSGHRLTDWFNTKFPHTYSIKLQRVAPFIHNTVLKENHKVGVGRYHDDNTPSFLLKLSTQNTLFGSLKPLRQCMFFFLILFTSWPQSRSEERRVGKEC